MRCFDWMYTSKSSTPEPHVVLFRAPVSAQAVFLDAVAHAELDLHFSQCIVSKGPQTRQSMAANYREGRGIVSWWGSSSGEGLPLDV